MENPMYIEEAVDSKGPAYVPCTTYYNRRGTGCGGVQFIACIPVPALLCLA